MLYIYGAAVGVELVLYCAHTQFRGQPVTICGGGGGGARGRTFRIQHVNTYIRKLYIKLARAGLYTVWSFEVVPPAWGGVVLVGTQEDVRPPSSQYSSDFGIEKSSIVHIEIGAFQFHFLQQNRESYGNRFPKRRTSVGNQERTGTHSAFIGFSYG